MFEFFIALFGGLYYGDKISAERAEVKNLIRLRKIDFYGTTSANKPGGRRFVTVYWKKT